MSLGAIRSQPLRGNNAEYDTARQGLGQWDDPVAKTTMAAELVIDLVELRRIIRGAIITGSKGLRYGPFTVELRKVTE